MTVIPRSVLVTKGLRDDSVKRRRRTKAELERLDEALYQIVDEQRPMTIRGAFYQAEVRDLVPKDETGYDVVQRRLYLLRTTGILPYGWITDGARIVHGHRRWDGVHDFAEEAARLYRRDYWARAAERIEVWIEKDALAGVIKPVVINEWGLDLWVSRGFSSITYLENAADSVWNRSGMYQTFIKSGLWLLLAILSIWSCNKQSVPDINAETSSLGYVLAHGTNTTIFNAAAVVKAGLDSLFSGPSIFTLFVPNDQACTQSGYPQSVINGFSSDQARQWVLYQTYAGTALTLESFIGKTNQSLLMADGDSIFITGASQSYLCKR